jgi:NAD(P)-dependent dehydrogenase (short-subunit alcohol dehydrogenase family)
MNQLDFKQRTAVVTGGAAGIGLAVARRLAASGAQVALWDRDDAALAKAKAGDSGIAFASALDISDSDAVARATAATEQALGRIDVLVCSAGITGPNAATWQYPPDAWRQVIDVNLNGLFYCNRCVVPAMLKNDYGRIVNIASVAGKEGNPNAVAYSASKAGVISLTKSLGKELATAGVCVNAITPAVIQTEMLKQSTQAHIDYMVSKIPMGRLGQVDEIAALVCWLASAECSFSTGAVFDISGGRATY